MQSDLAEYQTTDLGTLDDAEAIARLGKLIDLAADRLNRAGLDLALQWTQTIRERPLQAPSLARLYYFEANAWSGIARCEQASSEEQVPWDGPVSDANEEQILSLRKARQAQGFKLLDHTTRCQILTNLGSLMSHLGRFCEAIEYFDEAIEIDETFGMAWGNRGITLAHYILALPHLPHTKGTCATVAFLNESSKSFKKALSSKIEPHSVDYFRAFGSAVYERVNSARHEELDLDSIPLGDSDDEKLYRTWCLRNRLFCNTLNDIGTPAAAASDNIHLPGLVVPIGTGDYFIGMYNQIKQEYASSRFLLYHSHTNDSLHYSDKRVSLIDNSDHCVFGISVEFTKIALRMAYSLFDKLAFFINKYMNLGIPAKSVNFRTIWFEKQNKKLGLRAQFVDMQNWAFRGLFWMAKDFFTLAEGFQESLDPDARDLSSIRNHVEHKYLKTCDQLWLDHTIGTLGVEFDKEHSFTVGKEELGAKAMRMLKLARCAIMYLSYAVCAEEMQKTAEINDEDNVLLLATEWLADDKKLRPGL